MKPFKIQKLGDVVGLPELPGINFAEYAKAHKYDKSKKPEDGNDILFLNGVAIGSRGNIVVITGKAKSRKTVVASALSTSFFKEDGYLGFESFLKPGENVQHMDTEQGYSHYYESVSRMYYNAALDDMPKNFHSYRCRDLGHEDRIGLLRFLLDQHRPAVCIVDGVTDLVSNINDQDEATKLGEMFQLLSELYACCFVLVIHTTKSTGNMTGAVGTVLEKKCQTAIEVELLEGDAHNSSTVKCKYSRGRMFSDFDITWNDEQKCYLIGDEKRIKTKGKNGNKSPEAWAEDVHFLVLESVFQAGALHSKYFEDSIARKFKEQTKDHIGRPQAKALAAYYKEMNYVIDSMPGFLVLATRKKNQPAPVIETQAAIPFDKKDDEDLPF